MIPKYPLKWSSSIKYVDIDTGEVLTKKEATDKLKYIIVKNTQYVSINNNKSRGHTEYTAHCRKQPQLNIFADS